MDKLPKPIISLIADYGILKEISLLNTYCYDATKLLLYKQRMYSLYEHELVTLLMNKYLLDTSNLIYLLLNFARKYRFEGIHILMKLRPEITITYAMLAAMFMREENRDSLFKRNHMDKYVNINLTMELFATKKFAILYIPIDKHIALFASRRIAVIIDSVYIGISDYKILDHHEGNQILYNMSVKRLADCIKFDTEILSFFAEKGMLYNKKIDDACKLVINDNNTDLIWYAKHDNERKFTNILNIRLWFIDNVYFERNLIELINVGSPKYVNKYICKTASQNRLMNKYAPDNTFIHENELIMFDKCTLSPQIIDTLIHVCAMFELCEIIALSVLRCICYKNVHTKYIKKIIKMYPNHMHYLDIRMVYNVKNDVNVLNQLVECGPVYRQKLFNDHVHHNNIDDKKVLFILCMDYILYNPSAYKYHAYVRALGKNVVKSIIYSIYDKYDEYTIDKAIQMFVK